MQTILPRLMVFLPETKYVSNDYIPNEIFSSGKRVNYILFIPFDRCVILYTTCMHLPSSLYNVPD